MITLIDLFGVAVFAISGALVAAGAGLFALLTSMGISPAVTVCVGMSTALGLPLAAIRWYWGLPVFKI